MAEKFYRKMNPGNRGMALLLVVSVIALLSVVIINFSRSMQRALEDASQVRYKVLLESMAHSGLDIGIAVLQSDIWLNEFDSLLENWALLGDTPLDIGSGEGDVRIAIVDIDGRFPINSLVSHAEERSNPGEAADGLSPEKAREVLLRLLQSDLFAVEEEAQAAEIVDSITDWIDADDDELDNGAERSFYDSLEKPVVPRNGPIEFIEELLLVNGVTRDLLYGNDEKYALAEYVSVANSKSYKININTAPAALIQALDDRISDEVVEGLDEYRRDEVNYELLADTNWFIGYLPADIGVGELQALVTTQSRNFVIESEARHLGRYMNVAMEIERSTATEMKIISFHQD